MQEYVSNIAITSYYMIAIIIRKQFKYLQVNHQSTLHPIHLFPEEKKKKERKECGKILGITSSGKLLSANSKLQINLIHWNIIVITYQNFKIWKMKHVNYYADIKYRVIWLIHAIIRFVLAVIYVKHKSGKERIKPEWVERKTMFWLDKNTNWEIRY